MPGNTGKNDPAIGIRAMTIGDLDAIVALEKAVFSDPWPRDAFSDILSGEGWSALVAECDTGIIAYACCMTLDEGARLANIAVAESYRRKSVAKRLLARILDDAKKAECEYILLEVRPGNAEAITFYERHGFRHMYRRPHYYHSPTEDALVMVRYLSEDDENE